MAKEGSIIKMFKLKLPHPEEGFSMLEVLATALVIVGFLLGTLQATTLAALLRIKAQIKTESINWIKSDSAQIKYRASILDSGTADTTTCEANSGNGDYGNSLQNDLTSNSPTFPSTGTTVSILNKTYQVSRTYTNNNNLLQIRWQIWDEGDTVDTTNNPDENGNPTGSDLDDRSIAIISTEVLPDAALECY